LRKLPPPIIAQETLFPALHFFATLDSLSALFSTNTAIIASGNLVAKALEKVLELALSC
jgi:hypothetical protein